MTNEIQTCPLECELHTLIHTLALESSLPSIVVALTRPDINIPAIYVDSTISLNILHMLIISSLVWSFSRSEISRVLTGLLSLRITYFNLRLYS